MLLLIAMLTASPAAGSTTCRTFAPATQAEKAADARLVTAATGKTTTAIDIGATLRAGEWRIVWARPSDSEPGVLVFRGAQSIDIWGGVTSDRVGAVRWARKLGVPGDLAWCFADRLVQEGP